MKPIRVVLADDHAVVREGLRAVLAAHPGVEVVGEAGTSPEAVARAAETTPDVLCLDLSMPGGGAAATIQQAKAASPGTRSLVLSMHDDPAYVRSALTAGADGYLLKATRVADLVQAISEVAAGKRVLDPAATQALFAQMRQADPLAELSSRERQVFAALARGRAMEEHVHLVDSVEEAVELMRTRGSG